jgi:transposase
LGRSSFDFFISQGFNMGKPFDPAKERYWRRVLRQQVASGLRVGRFCERENISCHQFYWWRRTLEERDRGRTSAVGHGESARRVTAASPFLAMPLTVSLAAPVEIVHPRGHVVRLGAGFDDQALSRILAMLDAPTASAPEA